MAELTRTRAVGEQLRRRALRLPPPPATTITEAPLGVVAAERDRRYRRMLVYADGLAVIVAMMMAVVVIGDDRLRFATLLAVPMVVLVGKLMGLYDRDELLLNKTTLDEAPTLFQLATLYTLLTWLLEGYLIEGGLGNAQVVGLWGSLLGFSLLARAGARIVARHTVAPERCLIVGDPDSMRTVGRKLEGSPGLNATVVALLQLVPDEEHATVMEDLEYLIKTFDIHRVVLAPREADAVGTLDTIRLCKRLGVKVSLLPRLFEVVGSSVVFDDLNGLKVLGVRRFGLSRSSRAIKRGVDVAGAGLGVLAVAPLMAVLAVAIRMDSRGGVLFRQVRVGRDGERFEMLKFRTMVAGADACKGEVSALNETEGLFKIPDDPRITRIGGWLRRTSLDELPQLLNVLRGDMSLVGPRPLVVEEDCKVEGWHRRRLHLTPGMTGHWQTLGAVKLPLHEMVKIDYLYVANWSFWADVKILLRTVPYMLRGGNY